MQKGNGAEANTMTKKIKKTNEEAMKNKNENAVEEEQLKANGDAAKTIEETMNNKNENEEPQKANGKAPQTRKRKLSDGDDPVAKRSKITAGQGTDMGGTVMGDTDEKKWKLMVQDILKHLGDDLPTELTDSEIKAKLEEKKKNFLESCSEMFAEYSEWTMRVQRAKRNKK